MGQPQAILLPPVDPTTPASNTFLVGNGSYYANTSASGTRTALGATTVGANIFTLGNPGAITFLRMNADNTVTARSAANFKSDLSLGTAADATIGTSGDTVPKNNTANTFSATLTVAASLAHTGSTLGVFSQTPTGIQECGDTAAEDLAQVTVLVNQLRAGLINLGFFHMV